MVEGNLTDQWGKHMTDSQAAGRPWGVSLDRILTQTGLELTADACCCVLLPWPARYYDKRVLKLHQYAIHVTY